MKHTGQKIWRILSAAGLLGLFLCIGAMENGAPLLPGFIGAMACNGVFALGIELGGLTYKGDKL